MPPRKKKQDTNAHKVEESKEEGTKATSFTLNCSEEQRAKLAAAILQNGENNQDDSWAGRVLSYDYQEEIFYSETEDSDGEEFGSVGDGDSGAEEFGSGGDGDSGTEEENSSIPRSESSTFGPEHSRSESSLDGPETRRVIMARMNSTEAPQAF